MLTRKYLVFYIIKYDLFILKVKQNIVLIAEEVKYENVSIRFSRCNYVLESSFHKCVINFSRFTCLIYLPTKTENV